MRRLLLSALLVFATNAGAAAPRAHVPPQPAASPVVRLAAPALLTTPSALSLGAAPLAPAPTALSPSAALSLSAAPLPTPLSIPAALPPAAADAPAAAPALIDSLRTQDALSAGVSEKGDASAAAAHFHDAAQLGRLAADRRDRTVLSAPSDGPFGLGRLLRPLGAHKKRAQAEKADALYARLTAPRDPADPKSPAPVVIDDRGNVAERAALQVMLRRMLFSPTARQYAEQFLAEGHTAKILFTEVPDSRVIEADGRRIFYAPRAFTYWQSGRAEVHINRDYLDSDPDYLREDGPATLAHELLGHGLWYNRTHKESLHIPFHMGEDNETNAKLVGWLVGWELDERFHDTFPWQYLNDPARYLEDLKYRTPYYSSTFPGGKVGDPTAMFRARLAEANARIEKLREERERPVRKLELIDNELNILLAVKKTLVESLDFYSSVQRFAPPPGASAADPSTQDERSSRLAAQLTLEFPALEKNHALLVQSQERLAARSARVESFAERRPDDERLERIRARIAQRSERLTAHADRIAAMHDALLTVAAHYRLLVDPPPAEAPTAAQRTKRLETLEGLLAVFVQQHARLQRIVDRLARQRARLDRVAAADEERLAKMREAHAAKQTNAGLQAALYDAMKEGLTATMAFQKLELLREAAESPLFKRVSADVARLTAALRAAVGQ